MGPRIGVRARAKPGVIPGFLRGPLVAPGRQRTAMSHNAFFGPFSFEPTTARLWQEKQEIKLTRKAAAVLFLLVRRAGEPVAKPELFASVWGGTVVSDDALVTCIQELRKALGDDARHPRYIATRHRSGYLFVAEVSKA